MFFWLILKMPIGERNHKNITLIEFLIQFCDFIFWLFFYWKSRGMTRNIMSFMIVIDFKECDVMKYVRSVVVYVVIGS